MDSTLSAFEKTQETSNFLRTYFKVEKDESVAPVGIVLGSGLGPLGQQLAESKNAQIIDYSEIPHFPVSSVNGHDGRLIFGTIDGVKVLAMSGRIHRYEGYVAKDVAFPIRVLSALGVEKLLLTNSSGGIGEHLDPGDLMIIKDHINLSGDNPLVGPNDERFGPRFFDMTRAYSKELRALAHRISKDSSINLKEGIYCGVLGPCYETFAEIKMMRDMGGDAVGMSTIYETIVAHHMGIKVLAIACITNKAAGISKVPLTHEEVTERATLASATFSKLVLKLLPALASHQD